MASALHGIFNTSSLYGKDRPPGQTFYKHGRYMHILWGWAGSIHPDGCRWIVFGLVTPQDGLVTPPLCGLRADLLKKRPKFVKVVRFHRFSFMWCSNWLQIVKNHVLRFLPFYPLILAFQALSCLANDRSWRDLSIGIKNFQFPHIWLVIGPLLCFM